MIDLFHRALESSDPAISMIRLRRRQKFSRRLPLPAVVRDLLKADDDDDDEYDTNKDENDTTTEQETFCDVENENTIFLSTETDLFE